MAAKDDPPPGASALQELAADLAGLGHEVFGAAVSPADADPDVLGSLARVALARVRGADWVSVTTLRGTEFVTDAATDEQAVAADALQYMLGSGPCVDAIVEDAVFHAPRIAEDERWPKYGQRVADELGVASMLSFRLALEIDEVIGALNIYSLTADALGPDSIGVGRLLAVHGALIVSAAADRSQIAHLQKALESSREIGVAIGVIMAAHKVTRDEAFGLLRIASQHANRKLRDVATDVADTGMLALPAVGPGTGLAPGRGPAEMA